MNCIRCGLDLAHEDVQLAGMRAHGGPPIPTGVCLRCVMKDPNLRAELFGWSDARITRFKQRIRELAARPLEAIDRFVESFGEPAA